MFIAERTELLSLIDPDIINKHEISLAGLLFLGSLAIAENYFRRLISSILSFDLHSRLNSESQMIKFGAIDWYSSVDIGNALVDDGSFADSDMVKNKFKNIIGFDLSKNETIAAALAQFDIICQIRHCLVHANGTIRAVNAKRLNISKEKIGHQIYPSMPFLHSSIRLLDFLVREINSYICNCLISRMFTSQNEGFSLNWKTDKKLFKSYWSAFYSQIDMGVLTDADVKRVYLAYISHFDKR